MMTLPYAEPYKIKMTEAIRTSTREEREAWIREARYNLFKLRSDQVTIDLLTDSGTGSMSDRQWAAMMTGDESYAGASSYFRLKTTVAELFGMPWFLPTHQGRAAENVIFSALLKEGDIVPGNSHFDTTKGHIEFRRCHAVDCTIDAAADTQLELPFKGEMDLAKLEKVLAENPREKIPCVVLTVTNNTAGGQPVSMRNIRETAELCRRYGVPLLMDSARFAENAYFIKTREEGYASKTIKEIVREIYTYADIMTISAKKDGVVNMGGFVAMRSEELYKRAMTFSIMFEGYVTYGGMSGRDMDALAVGLDENTEFEQLDARIRQMLQEVSAALEKRIAQFGLDSKIQQIAKMTQNTSVREWKRAVKDTLGIDILDDYYSGELYEQAIQRWIAENVAYIKSLPTETLGNMRQIILDGYLNGRPIRDIQKDIQSEYGTSKRHAQLLARDQLATLNAQITKMQQTDAGCKKYRWSTSHDSRVRPCHAALNGKTFDWNDPPEMWYDTKAGRVYTGRKCHPGEDYCCRCVAIPVFDYDGVNIPMK